MSLYDTKVNRIFHSNNQSINTRYVGILFVKLLLAPYFVDDNVLQYNEIFVRALMRMLLVEFNSLDY